ncbi:MAG TPA: hypothetical protein VGK94_07920 [Candidatus Polarisedimenticolia bacterium]|jgi:hypothetical protein
MGKKKDGQAAAPAVSEAPFEVPASDPDPALSAEPELELEKDIERDEMEKEAGDEPDPNVIRLKAPEGREMVGTEGREIYVDEDGYITLHRAEDRELIGQLVRHGGFTEDLSR